MSKIAEMLASVPENHRAELFQELGRFYPLMEDLFEDLTFDLWNCVSVHVYGGNWPQTGDYEDASPHQVTLRRWRELERYLEAMLSMRLAALKRQQGIVPGSRAH